MNNQETKNYPHFSWAYLTETQKSNLTMIKHHHSRIFADNRGYIFQFVRIDETFKGYKFEVYTIPDRWLTGVFELNVDRPEQK